MILLDNKTPEEIKKKKYRRDYLRNIEQKTTYAKNRYHELKNDKDFKEKKRLAQQKYYKKNKEKIRKKQDTYDLLNRTHLLDVKKQRNHSEEGKEIRNNWEKNNRTHIQNYVTKRKEKNSSIIIGHRVVEIIRTATINNINTDLVKKILGCEINFFRKYLEKQFDKKMNWNNYGYYGWHLEHIKPICLFDLTIEENIKQCFNYKNYQPMWRADNQSKGKNYDN